MKFSPAWLAVFSIVLLFAAASRLPAQKTEKPVLHGRNWVAITGKPLAATAGAMIFMKGGNAVDAACAMLGAVCTMHDVLSWGGETQALIYDPRSRKVVGINALGVAPSGATAEFYKGRGFEYPPEDGPLSAVTPGTPGGLLTMLAEYGTMSLAQVLEPAIRLADGYPMDQETSDRIEREKQKLKQWKNSAAVLLVHPGEAREAPAAGEVFRQNDLAATLRRLVEAEQAALRAGKDRKQAIYAAYDRFYRGDIAAELVRAAREEGALFTMEDLDRWKVYIEEPVSTNYRGIEVFKLTSWVQGPVMLQALNMLERFDLKKLGYNSAEYVHLLYQVMNLAFADRDFYYGDPYFPPEEPLQGLLSKRYAAERAKLIRFDRNDPDAAPGDPYPFQNGRNPYLKHLERWLEWGREAPAGMTSERNEEIERVFRTGTTSIQAADKEGWVVSVTPSGGWLPCLIAGRTGIGLSQRAQSFVLDEYKNPFNVIAPGKRPRATLTPGLALKDGKPFLSFAVQGGDTQDQNLLQFFLDVVEFGMTVQQACEAPNITSYQMHDSFKDHKCYPGKLDVNESMPQEVRRRLESMGYVISVKKYTSGPINAVFFDGKSRTFWGGSSNYGEDYGIAW